MAYIFMQQNRANLDVLEVNDLNRAKLAKHNLSREQLEDRQMSADAGLE